MCGGGGDIIDAITDPVTIIAAVAAGFLAPGPGFAVGAALLAGGAGDCTHTEEYNGTNYATGGSLLLGGISYHLLNQRKTIRRRRRNQNLVK